MRLVRATTPVRVVCAAPHPVARWHCRRSPVPCSKATVLQRRGSRGRREELRTSVAAVAEDLQESAIDTRIPVTVLVYSSPKRRTQE